MLRLLVGNDYKYLLPLSCLGGGILLVFADAIARSWFDPIELPVGILLSFLGGPFFLYLIHRGENSVISVNKVFYAHSERFQMQNMNVHIKAGEVVSLIGPNGSGKSTLLRLIARLLKQSEGDIVLDGKSIHTMKSADVAKQLAMLPQMHDHQLDLTVKELIEFGRGPHKLWRGRLNKEDEEIVDWALSVTNLEGYEYRLLQSLSGGKDNALGLQ